MHVFTILYVQTFLNQFSFDTFFYPTNFTIPIHTMLSCARWTTNRENRSSYKEIGSRGKSLFFESVFHSQTKECSENWARCTHSEHYKCHWMNSIGRQRGFGNMIKNGSDETKTMASEQTNGHKVELLKLFTVVGRIFCCCYIFKLLLFQFTLRKWLMA